MTTALTLAQRTELIVNDPTTLEKVCAHVANGGTALDLCRAWDIRYSDLVFWLNADATRKHAYESSLRARGEWGAEMILAELRNLATVDYRQAFNDDGSLRPIKDIPREVIMALSAIEVDEIWDGRGESRRQIGETKKLKFTDRLKALQLLGVNLKLFIQEVNHSGKVTLEDLVVGSRKPEYIDAEVVEPKALPEPVDPREPA